MWSISNNLENVLDNHTITKFKSQQSCQRLYHFSGESCIILSDPQEQSNNQLYLMFENPELAFLYQSILLEPRQLLEDDSTTANNFTDICAILIFCEHIL
jgi:hypothetical protein